MQGFKCEEKVVYLMKISMGVREKFNVKQVNNQSKGRERIERSNKLKLDKGGAEYCNKSISIFKEYSKLDYICSFIYEDSIQYANLTRGCITIANGK